MSDPLTNSEIQDVLSSIRRLVSEDNRHRTERERGRAGPGAEAGKLVLTEALRVADHEPEAKADAETETGTDTRSGVAALHDAAPEVTGDADDDKVRDTITGEGRFQAEGRNPAIAEAEAGDAWEETADAEVGTLEDTIAELEAAVAGIGDEFEPDGSEVARGREIDAELEEAFEEGFAVDAAAEDEAADLAQPVTGGAIGGSGTDVATGTDTGADAEPGVGPFAAAAEAGDGPAADARAAGDGDGPETADHTADAAEGPEVAGADHLDFGTEGVGDSDDGRARTPISDAGAAEEADRADDHAPPAFIPSGRVRTGYDTGYDGAAAEGVPPADRPRRLTLTAADAVAPWGRDDVAPAADREPPEAATEAPGLASALAGDIADESEGAAADGDESSLFDAGGDVVIDMDMLRDLVAEIIREELQGTLGERITRNVRMLVRREISRALETHKFE